MSEKKQNYKQSFLTPEEVCDLLNINQSLLYRLQNEKQFPVIKIGHRTLRYDKQAIEKWLSKFHQGLWINT